jgi:tetratricopeptide (TPR) repeat protein
MAGEEQIVEASEPEVAEAVIAAAVVEETPPPPEPEAPAMVSRDDSSYPPVDLDNHFFDGERQSRPSYAPFDEEERDPRMALKLTPEVARRRANLSRYVKLAVAGASALCLAALVKVAVAHNSTDSGRARPVAMAAAAPPPAKTAIPATPLPTETAAAAAPATPPPAETAAAAAPATPPPAETAAAAAPATAAPAETAAAPVAAPAETAAAAPAPTEAPELDPKAAAKEKNASRSLLERGKDADAIAAGERSVALDPTDGEAWLILGAAYQEKGDMKNARRSYKACLEQGKRGPKYECAAMPH